VPPTTSRTQEAPPEESGGAVFDHQLTTVWVVSPTESARLKRAQVSADCSGSTVADPYTRGSVGNACSVRNALRMKVGAFQVLDPEGGSSALSREQLAIHLEGERDVGVT
jgi:hypothetical protein